MSNAYSNESAGIHTVIWNTIWVIWVRQLKKRKPRQECCNILIICAQNDTQCDIALRFGHAQETICQKIYDVLEAIEQMAVDYLRPWTSEELTAISNRLQGHTNY